MKKLLLLMAITTLLLSAALPGHQILAKSETLSNVETFAQTIGYEKTDIYSYISVIINIIFSLLGTIFLVLIIYAGILWMTAGGKQDQVTKATGIIKNSVIGLIIIVAAYAITEFIITALN